MNDKEMSIPVWEKVIEITEDGECVGYFFKYTRKFQQIQKEDEVKSHDESGRATVEG